MIYLYLYANSIHIKRPMKILTMKLRSQNSGPKSQKAKERSIKSYRLKNNNKKLQIILGCP